MNAPPPPTARRIIQIATCAPEGSPVELYALDDAGDVWCRTHDGRGWYRFDISVITSGAA